MLNSAEQYELISDTRKHMDFITKPGHDNFAAKSPRQIGIYLHKCSQIYAQPYKLINPT